MVNTKGSTGKGKSEKKSTKPKKRVCAECGSFLSAKGKEKVCKKCQAVVDNRKLRKEVKRLEDSVKYRNETIKELSDEKRTAEEKKRAQASKFTHWITIKRAHFEEVRQEDIQKVLRAIEPISKYVSIDYGWKGAHDPNPHR